MDPKHTLTIVIVSYNSFSAIRECLDSVCMSERYRVIIVDNASSDGSADKLVERYPHVAVLNLQQNIGYGRAANIGFERATTEFALLLNPDVKASLAQIDQLLSHALKCQKDTAVLAPLIGNQAVPLTDAVPETVDWVSGCAMLINLKMLQQVGFFDERIFLYFEETALFKSLIRSQFKIKLCRDVCFQHLEGQSSTSDARLDLEITKAWHYGWSKAYYYAQYEPNNSKKRPLKQFCLYALKSLMSQDREKRLMYQYRAGGVWAFIKKMEAFDAAGAPKKFTC